MSDEQFDRVLSYQEIGRQEAKLALGGGRATGGALDRGLFVEPTIFYDVDNSARIAREEIFGPVAAVIPFDDEEDAIRIANDTDYGLAAAVWTRDIFRAMRTVKRLARRHRVGQPHAADVRRGAVGRLQAKWHRPRAREVGCRGVPAREAGAHQPQRAADRVVLSALACHPAAAPRVILRSEAT